MTDNNEDRISFSTVTDKQTRRALRNGFKAIGSTPYAAADALFTYAYVSDQGKAGDTFKQQEEDIKSGGIEGAWKNFKSRNTDTLENTIQWPVYFTTCAILYALRQTQIKVEREKKLQHRQSIKTSRIYESYRFSAARPLVHIFQKINGLCCSEDWARPLFVRAAQGIDPAKAVRANIVALNDSTPDWHLSEYDMAVLEYFANSPDSSNKNFVNPTLRSRHVSTNYLCTRNLYIRYLLMIVHEDRHMTNKEEFLKIAYMPYDQQFDKATPVNRLLAKYERMLAESEQSNRSFE
jgi:hypothetical protein